MATKKSSAKPATRTTTKKRSAASKPRQTRVKSTTTRKTRAAKPAPMASLHLVKETKPFMTTRTSRETLYWVVLGLVVIAFASWIMKLQSEIQSIYDSIDATNTTIMLETPAETTHHKSHK